MQSALQRSRIPALAALLFLGAGAALTAGPASAQVFSVGPAYDTPVEAPDWRRDGRWDNRDHRRWDGHGSRRWDREAPVITDVTPEHGDRVSDRGRTRIAARYHDTGSGVAEVSLRIDGREVSHEARIDADGIRYRDDLVPGRHVAELVVRDRAGNATRHVWRFRVVDEGRYRPYAQNW